MGNLQDKFFRKYSGALIFTVYPHERVQIDDDLLRRQVIESKSLFGRYYTVNQENTYGGWWHCIKSEPIALDSLKAKQRYRINKGLKLNHCRRCSNPEEIELNELTEMLEESFSDYPKVYKPKSNFSSYAKTILSQCRDNRYDVWLINSKQDSKLIGLGVCRLEQDIVVLQVVKVRPSFLKDEVNAALAYTLCNYYLESNKYKYITDGERNIRHKSNYQDFLVNVLGFRRLYCNLHIVYHPFVAPFVKILYPFRKLIHRMEDCNRLIYNISCVLKQEEIAKATYC